MVPQKASTNTIQFFVKTLEGDSITICESLCTTGGQLKARLEVKTGIPAAQQRLTYIKKIEDFATLREISLPDKGTIHMSLYLKGGMEKENTKKQNMHNVSIHVHTLDLSVTHSSQGYEITGISPDSPASNDDRISRDQILLKINQSFCNLRDIDSVKAALQGDTGTSITLSLRSPLESKVFRTTLIRQQNHPLSPMSEDVRERPDRSPSHSPRSEHDRPSQPSGDTSPSPGNSVQKADEEIQALLQDQADTRAVIESMDTLLFIGGQPEDR